jgi:hypothetical protein
MEPEVDTLTIGANEVKNMLSAVCKESFGQENNGGFRDLCAGLEVALQMFKEKGVAIALLRMEFFADAIGIDEVILCDGMPSNYNVEGIWAVIYAALTPRQHPFGPDPLRVRSLSIGYQVHPSLTYDGEHDNGLPMSMDRPYDPAKTKDMAKR